MKKIKKLKDNKYLSTECVVHGNKKLSQILDTKIIVGQEVATNEFIGEKRIYTKEIDTFEIIGGGNNFKSIPHNIENADTIWIDLSNTFFKESTGMTYSMPMIMYGGSTNKDAVQIYVDKTNINFISDGGWGETWEKHIRLKYTKLDK